MRRRIRMALRVMSATSFLMVLLLAPSGPTLAAEPDDTGGFVAEALPYPVPGLDNLVEDRCLAGVEGVHRVSRTFTAKGSGSLHVSLDDGFKGDWDLAVMTPKGELMSGSQKEQLLGASPVESVAVDLADGQEVAIVACNWLGEPEVKVRWEFWLGTQRGTGVGDE